MRLGDFNSIYSSREHLRNLKEYARNISLISDRDSDLENGFDLLKKKAEESGFPKYLVERVIKQVKTEEGHKEAILWDINWRTIVRVIEEAWGIQVRYVNRKYVEPDGWCMVRAISNLVEDEIKDFLNRCLNNSIDQKYQGFLSSNFQIDMLNLIEHKKWDSDLDCLPLILADTLGISVLVITVSQDSMSGSILLNKENFMAYTARAVVLRNDHYWKLEVTFGTGRDIQIKFNRPTMVMPLYQSSH